MDALFTAPIGLEEVSALDLKDMGVSVLEKGRGWIRGGVKDYLHLAEITYRSRGIKRGILLLKEAKVSFLDDVYSAVKEIDWEPFIHPDTTFACRSSRMGAHPFTHLDVERISGAAIIDSLPYRPKVNLENPDVIVRVNLYQDRLFIGIDFTGIHAMDKRRYRAFDHRAALNPVIASLMVRLAQKYSKNLNRLLDPFTGGATIPIEACHRFRNVPAGYFRKGEMGFTRLPFLKNVNWHENFDKWDGEIRWDVKKGIFAMDNSPKSIEGAMENLEKAMVKDCIDLRLMDMEGMDSHFENIDAIITNPPYGIREGNLKRALKLHRALSEKGKKVLRKGGIMVVITPHYHMFEGWDILEKRQVVSGGLEVFVMVMHNP